MILKRFLIFVFSLIVLIAFLILPAEIVLRYRGHKPFTKYKQNFEVDSFLQKSILSNKKPIMFNDLHNYFNIKNKIIYKTIGSKKFNYLINSIDSRNSGRKYNIGGLNNINIYGCSFTFGDGLNDEETFSYILQGRLRQFNINNYGVSGYGILDIYEKIINTIDTNTRIVIINYAHFQSDRLPGSRYWNKYRCMYLNNTQVNFLMKHIHIPLIFINQRNLEYDTVLFKRYIQLPLQDKLAIIEVLSRIYEEKIERITKNKLEISNKLIKKIKKLCVEKNILLVITNIDGYIQTEKDIKYFSKNSNFIYLDFKVPNDNKKYNLYPDDGHPNALANQIFADSLFQCIQRINISY